MKRKERQRNEWGKVNESTENKTEGNTEHRTVTKYVRHKDRHIQEVLSVDIQR